MTCMDGGASISWRRCAELKALPIFHHDRPRTQQVLKPGESMSDPKPAPKRWRDKFRDLSTLRRRVRAPPAGERQSSPNVSPPVGPLSATRFPLKQPNLWGRALESLFQDESKEKLLRKYEESILNQDSPHVANAAQAQNTALSSIGGASGSVWRQTLRDRADEARAAVQISTAENVKTHLANAVDIILVFEGVAGSVASLDPNAALAWSGACFLLTVCLYKSEYLELLIYELVGCSWVAASPWGCRRA